MGIAQSRDNPCASEALVTDIIKIGQTITKTKHTNGLTCLWFVSWTAHTILIDVRVLLQTFSNTHVFTNAVTWYLTGTAVWCEGIIRSSANQSLKNLQNDIKMKLRSVTSLCRDTVLTIKDRSLSSGEILTTCAISMGRGIVWVNIGSGNGLLPEPILTYHQ